MKQYIDTVQDTHGNALNGVQVKVYDYNTAALATIYSDAGLTVVSGSTVTSDSTGQFSFYAPNGDYILRFYYHGTLIKTQTPVTIFDGADERTFTDTGSANAYVISDTSLPLAYFDKMRVSVRITNTNTSSSTLKINSLATRAIVNLDGTAIGASTLVSGSTYRFEYKSSISSFVLIGQGLSDFFFRRTAAEIANGVTPTNYSYAPGSWQRYGASTSATDNGTAINNSLLCNPVSFDAENSVPALYAVQTTIRFRAAGQTLRGQGFADSNLASVAGVQFAPRTTLKWTGSSGGSLVSVSDGAANYSETILKDICLDGNSLCNKGVEGYADSITGGCWRNLYERCVIMNCTSGANASGIYFGAGPTHFCNDPYVYNCYIWSNTVGIYNNGAVPQIVHCTIGLNTTGILMPGNGSEIKTYGGVFHTNTRDIDVGASSAIQNVACFGTWFENCPNPLFRAQNSFNLQMIGCHLHNLSSSGLMDFGGQAGNATVKSWVAASTTNSTIIGTNPGYEYDLLGSGIVTDKGYRIRISATTALARIDNADFMCGPTGDAANATGDGTAFNMNAAAVTEDHDLSNAVNASTGVFTAPADGYYTITVHIQLTNVGAAHTDGILTLIVAGTSAQNWLLDRTNVGAVRTAGNESHLTGTARVFMTKNDTCYPQVTISGSTKTVTVASGGTANNWRTRFLGRLA